MVRTWINKLVFVVALLTVAGVAAVYADTVRLKDGSIIKGKITGFAGGKFTVTIGEGDRRRVLSFDASEVESIEFDPPSVVAVPASTSAGTRSGTGNVPRVITTDNTAGTTPRPRPEPVDTARSTPPTTVPTTPVSTTQPVELNVRVLADDTANGWTNSGWVVKKGQRIRLTGTGEISIGNGVTTGPSGLYAQEDPQKLMSAVPTGALIAVIGDDNNDFIYVGADREFIAERDGVLFLGINEGRLDDNSGGYDVKIQIRPS